MTNPDLPEATLVAHTLRLVGATPSLRTRERLAQALLDWFTAGLSAAALPSAGRFRALGMRLAPGEGGSPVFGGAPASPLAAGFANAGIAHLREIDDAHRAAMLHPGVVAVSPVLALAPVLGLSQARAMQAVLAGYEVALRVGEAMGAGHAARFHATATAGSVGAAAASAVALGLEAGPLHHALGIAATQAAGLWQLVDDGAHEAKSLHPAFAVRNGLSAAFAAESGFPGATAFVTGQRGMRALLAGDGPVDALLGQAGEPERLHTATIKAWPACAMLFTPLDAALSLIEAHALRAGDVAAVDVEIFSHALRIAGIDWPATPAEAPFSLRYLLAVLLQEGRIGIAQTEAPALDAPALRALAGRITVRASEAFQQAFPARRPSRVTVTLTSGRQLSAYRELRRGDPEDPYTWPALQARMRAFAPTIDDTQAAALVQACERLPQPSLDDLPLQMPARLFAA